MKLLAVLPLVFASVLDATEPDYVRASCRVTCRINGNQSAKGSGVIIDRTESAYFILTNAHVASRQDCRVEFWLAGRRSNPLPAPRIWYRQDAWFDLAILRLDASQLGGFSLPVIPLAERGTTLERGSNILSVGNANATWQTSWSGHVLSSEVGRLRFVPTPAQGRSGSAIFNEDGSRVVGLIAWRSNSGVADGVHEQDGHGIAISSELIWTAFQPARTQPSGAAPTGRLVEVASPDT